METGNKDASVRYRQILQRIEQLQYNLLDLDRRAKAMAVTETSTEAMSAFRKLPPMFDEVLSFVAVVDTQTNSLEEPRRTEVQTQLRLLRRQLARMHLGVAAPLLRRIEEEQQPLALGARLYMERWLASLDELHQRLTDGIDTAVIASDLVLFQQMQTDSKSIANRAMDLMDFDDEQNRLPPARPMLVQSPAASERRAAQEDSDMIRLVITHSGGRNFIDARGSSALMMEIRRMGLQQGLALALNVNPGNLVMVLNGRDPISSDRLPHAVDYLRRHIGEQRFEYIND